MILGSRESALARAGSRCDAIPRRGDSAEGIYFPIAVETLSHMMEVNYAL